MSLAIEYLGRPFRGQSGYTGTYAQIFASADNAPQGMTAYVIGADQKILMRLDGSGTFSGDVGGQICRYVQYTLPSGGGEVHEDFFTSRMNCGHHGLGSYFDNGNLKIVGPAPTTTAHPEFGRRSVQIIDWIGLTTSNANVRNYCLLKNEGDTWSTEYYGDLASCSSDGKYILMLCQPISNNGGANNVSKVLVYRRTDLEAIAQNPATGFADCTEVDPYAEFNLVEPGVYDAFDYQDVASDGQTLWTLSGSTSPFGVNYVQQYDLSTGDLLQSFPYDGARSNWSHAQVLGAGIQYDLEGVTKTGMPISLEPEGIALAADGKILTLSQTVLGVPKTVVTHEGRNYALIWDEGHDLPPGSDRSSALTTLAATETLDWSPTATYEYGYKDFKKEAMVHALKTATGAAGEKGVKSNRSAMEPNAQLVLGQRTYQVAVPFDDGRLAVGRYNHNTGEWRPTLVQAEGLVRMWDTPTDGYPTDTDKWGYVHTQVRGTGATREEFVEIGLGHDVVGTNPVSYLRIRGPEDGTADANTASIVLNNVEHLRMDSKGRLKIRRYDTSANIATEPNWLTLDVSGSSTWTAGQKYAGLAFANDDGSGAGSGGTKSWIAAYIADTDGAESGLTFGTSASGTSVANRWNIIPSGHLQPASTNTVDIGGSSARVRKLYTTALSAVLGDYANDAAAAVGGVAVGDFYRTGNAVKVRIA